MEKKKPQFSIEWHSGFLFSVISILLITTIRFGGAQGLVCTALFFLSLFAHEAGHMCVARMNRTRVKAVGFCKWGVYLRREKAHSAFSEIAIAGSGPVVNLLVAFFVRDLTGTGPFAWLAQMNVVLFLINIAPFGGSDGKRIVQTLRELQSCRPTPHTAAVES